MHVRSLTHTNCSGAQVSPGLFTAAQAEGPQALMQTPALYMLIIYSDLSLLPSSATASSPRLTDMKFPAAHLTSLLFQRLLSPTLTIIIYSLIVHFQSSYLIITIMSLKSYFLFPYYTLHCLYKPWCPALPHCCCTLQCAPGGALVHATVQWKACIHNFSNRGFSYLWCTVVQKNI